MAASIQKAVEQKQEARNGVARIHTDTGCENDKIIKK
jgi:hypothetical protein